MHWLMRGIGVAVTLGLIAVSVMMNFRFGQSLGRTEFDAMVYGLASACADGFKVILPFAIMAAWYSSRRMAAIAGAALWLVFTAYSMTSSLGHSATNRAETAGERRHQMADYQDLRRSLELKLKEREGLPKFRPVGAVEAELEASRRSRSFERTSGCVEVALGRAFCEGHARLEAERQVARRAAVLDTAMSDLRAQLAATSGEARSGESDAQTALLKQVSGLTEDYVRLGLTLLVSIMVELGSGLGLYLVLGRKPSNEGKAAGNGFDERSRVVMRRLLSPSAERAWKRARVSGNEDAYASEIDLYRDYCLWIVRQNRGPALTLGAFRSWLAAEKLGEPARKRGRNYYVGIELKGPAVARDAGIVSLPAPGKSGFTSP